MRKKVVAVVGSGKQSHQELAEEVGTALARLDVHLITGGGPGVMAAVTEGFIKNPTRRGITIGIIPGSKDGTTKARYPNESVDVVIRTHLQGLANPDETGGADPMGNYSRNHVNVRSADLVIALPGGDGTFAEMSLAKVLGRPVLAVIPQGGVIAGRTAAQLAEEGYSVFSKTADLVAAVDDALAAMEERNPGSCDVQ